MKIRRQGNRSVRPRVAASPDTVKKFKALGVEIAVEPVPASGPAFRTLNSPPPAPPSAAIGCRHHHQGEAAGALKLANFKRGALVIAIMILTATTPR